MNYIFVYVVLVLLYAVNIRHNNLFVAYGYGSVIVSTDVQAITTRIHMDIWNPIYMIYIYIYIYIHTHTHIKALDQPNPTNHLSLTPFFLYRS